jgi:5-methyltetrahydrofolate--homocysteine methyltransferase
VVIGVISPDIHDIGKNQVAMLLTRRGARVHDLGADVEPAQFAAKAREAGADAVLVGASTQRALFMLPDVRSALEQAGVESRLIVGGQAALAADEVPQADAVVADAYEAVDEILRAREVPA